MAFEVRDIRGIFRDVSSRNMHRRAREVEDHRYYSGINNGQWTQSAVEKLTEEGRAIITWNFIKKHIDTESGMLMQTPFEFSFASEIGQDDLDAELMNELRFRDKDLGRWNAEKSLFINDGLINTGVMETYIDRRKDRMGAINYRRRIATDFHFDPDWRTEDIQDNRQIFEAGYFDIVSIMEQWGNTIDKKIDIQEAFKSWQEQRNEDKTEKGSNVQASRNSSFIDMPEELNGKFLVEQMLELQDVQVNKLFNRSTGKFLKETLGDVAPEDRRDAFALMQDREQAELTEIPTNEKILMVHTIAPGLSQELFLADNLHEIQIGTYPLTVWSAYNFNGDRYGRVSQLKDPQAVANKSRAIWLQAQSQAGRQNKFIGPNAFSDGDEQLRYEAERSKGGGNFDVNDPSAIVNEDNGKPPQDLEQTFNDALTFSDKVGSPLSAQGQSKSGTSGILFNAEREQAAVGLTGINNRLEKAENDMGEHYVDLALSFYDDDIVRQFKSIKDKKDIFINSDDRTRIGNMTRMSVRIDQAPVGASVKRENLNILTQLMQASSNPLELASLSLLRIPLLPGLTEEAKESMTKDAEQVLDTARLQDQAIAAQAQAAIQQSGGQPQQAESQENTAPQDPELQVLIQQVSGADNQLPQGSESQGII